MIRLNSMTSMLLAEYRVIWRDCGVLLCLTISQESLGVVLKTQKGTLFTGDFNLTRRLVDPMRLILRVCEILTVTVSWHFSVILQMQTAISGGEWGEVGIKLQTIWLGRSLSSLQQLPTAFLVSSRFLMLLGIISESFWLDLMFSIVRTAIRLKNCL